ncbi:YbcC family protein [Salinispirillum marinum]|uniref:Probable inorganic carbon transporter subunit DabA n=2 Tax=Saccharospirillaceae TaxID=255527 RepID=A0ABV8BD71_9GAMM
MSTQLASNPNQMMAAQWAAVQDATGRIAPTWPLDQMIAVNPYWMQRDLPLRDVSARLSALGGVQCLLPAAEYARLRADKRIDLSAVSEAASLLQWDGTLAELEAVLVDSTDTAAQTAWLSIAARADQERSPFRMLWQDEVVHQISQFCAAHYQTQRPLLGRGRISDQLELYAHWLDVTQRDLGIGILLAEPEINRTLRALPDSPAALIQTAIEEMGIRDETLADYCHALLLDINGWASYTAYLSWQAQLYQETQNDSLDLLAIRMAWELTIWRHLRDQYPAKFQHLKAAWQHAQRHLPALLAEHKAQQAALWVWATALELTEQRRLQLTLTKAVPAPETAPTLQAVFCIDVRSEVYRRALEAQDAHIHTLGFAGFFGLPIAYEPASTPLSRPQLPGLLRPVISVVATTKDTTGSAGDRKERLQTSARWQDWSRGAPSSFSMVEAAGWWYAFKMLKNALFPGQTPHPVNQLMQTEQWTLQRGEVSLSIAEQADLAQGILHAMGMTTFAPHVLLVGHGSHSTNNLHAASLDCGACGGQSGEINVRVLAQLLNNTEVRAVLTERGLNIPAETQFIAALHNTTTDGIQCFDDVPATVRTWLDDASRLARRERAARLDPKLAQRSDEDLEKALHKRANDWSQVRPEWGLANNSAFIMAPRAWTRNADLQGRVFLHDYHAAQDPEGQLLTQLMTAPMVVTNWINMQYNASVTDNLKYGSGNKVLHNAVGGNIGVFEGNGGDLRIGLSMQSIHDGTQWQHMAQRLAVYIAAPRERIAEIAQREAVVRDLVDNDQLYLFHWDLDRGFARWYQGTWHVPLVG